MHDCCDEKESAGSGQRIFALMIHSEGYGGNPKILAKIGNSVVEPLLKTVQTAEERGEVDKRNA